MQAQDVYKLLYQSVLGPEHLIASSEAFLIYLQSEWETMGDAPVEDSLLERIRPDGELFRVNLRPYRNLGGRAENLAQACLGTAAEFSSPQPARERIQPLWEAFLRQPGASCPSLAGDDVQDFSAWLKVNAYPAVHHSTAYREIYRPAYRLVSARCLPRLNLSSE